MSDTPILCPGNDLSIAIGPFETVSSAGVKTALTGGSTVTAFLATAETPDQTTADASFAATCSYIGGANGYAAGWFLFQLDASVLTDALLQSKFASRGEAFAHAISSNNIRIVVRLEYQRTRWAAMA